MFAILIIAKTAVASVFQDKDVSHPQKSGIDSHIAVFNDNKAFELLQ